MLAVPNVSEGRDRAAVAAIGQAYVTAGLRLLDVHTDPDHHRSVHTVAGTPGTLGRALLAVRDNEQAASAMGLSPARVKLFAFAVSGGLAGVAGGLLVGLLVQFTPEQFTATASLQVVAVAVVGGLASITGTVLGSLFIVGLPAFFPDSPAPESAALQRLVASLGPVKMHIDLHETTDTDESEFRPARAARDGKPFEPGTIPDGFYLVGDSENPQPEFQQAVIAAVEQVTHIAPADADGNMIGSPVVAHGVINYPLKKLGLCASVSGAKFATTTEVYPDSPSATPEQCNAAQVAAIRAAIDFALQAES